MLKVIIFFISFIWLGLGDYQSLMRKGETESLPNRKGGLAVDWPSKRSAATCTARPSQPTALIPSAVAGRLAN